MKRKVFLFLMVLATMMVKSQSWPYVVPNQDYLNFFSQRDIASNVPNAIDANNSVYSTGYIGTAAGSADLIVLKYDSLGVLSYSLPYNNGGYDKGYFNLS